MTTIETNHVRVPVIPVLASPDAIVRATEAIRQVTESIRALTASRQITNDQSRR